MLNEPVGFLAQVGFLTPMIFRISVAAELGRPALADTSSNSIAIPRLSAPCADLGIPSMLKLHWLKPPFARKPPDSFIN